MISIMSQRSLLSFHVLCLLFTTGKTIHTQKFSCPLIKLEHDLISTQYHNMRMCTVIDTIIIIMHCRGGNVEVVKVRSARVNGQTISWSSSDSAYGCFKGATYV